jgi:hypothetical protein
MLAVGRRLQPRREVCAGAEIVGAEAPTYDSDLQIGLATAVQFSAMLSLRR